MTNTEENTRLMLPTTKVKVEGMEVTALEDTGASASFFQMEWSKQSAIESCTSEEAYQVRTAMGKEEMVSKQAKKNREIAGLNIPHTFLLGKIAPNCSLRSNLFSKTSWEVDFKANKL